MLDTKGTILIVDDEDNIRRLMRGKLSQAGYQCEEASNADVALGKLKANPVGLVFLDINMPGKPGTELLPEIKVLYPDTEVIMVTANDDVSTAIQCVRLGAYDYITKPFSMDEIVLSANRAIENRWFKLENRDYQQHLEQKVDEQSRKLRASFLSAITALVYALEAKDKYTSGHSQRVSELSSAIARELGIKAEDIEKIQMAGMTHDIGKIGLKESVLNKPVKLTDEEYRHVKSHPAIGERILTPIVDDTEILKIVRHHHEHYNGVGYPEGLAGQQIPLGARILAMVDAYDAMTSERPYRNALSLEAACAEIERCKGAQFDPDVADAFLRIRGLSGTI